MQISRVIFRYGGEKWHTFPDVSVVPPREKCSYYPD